MSAGRTFRRVLGTSAGVLAAAVALALPLVTLTWPDSLASRPLARDNLERLTQTRPRYMVVSRRLLEQPDFHGQKLEVIGFSRSRLERPRFDGATVSGALFYVSHLREASFRGAELRAVTFQGSRLASADFRDARATHFVLVDSDLRGADLRGADLSSSFITMSRLEGALFNGATRLPFPRAEAERRGMRYVE